MRARRDKLLTFQSWVTCRPWYEYAVAHRSAIPFLLTDRSPCQDPFFDPFALPIERRPVISGLCRCLKHFQQGDKYLYITRIDARLMNTFGIERQGGGPHYFLVAALTVIRTFASHEEAATAFSPRQYVAKPERTPYPPNLAHQRPPEGAAARESCIVFDSMKNNAAHTPASSDTGMWERHCREYHARAKRRELGATLCEVEHVDGREAMRLVPGEANVITPAAWGGQRLNVYGISLGEETSRRLREQLAASPLPDSP